MEKREQYSTIQFLKDLFYIYRNHKKKAAFLLTTLSISYILLLIPPIITAKIVDFFAQGQKDVGVFYAYLFLLSLASIVGVIMRLLSKNHFRRLTHKVEKETKVEMMQRLLAQSLSWHEQENTGSRIQRISSGLDGIERLVKFTINEGVQLIISMIAILGFFFAINTKYFLMALLFVATYMTAEIYYNRKVIQKTKEINIERERVMGQTYEFSSNIRTVKSLGLESSLEKKIDYEEGRLLKMSEERSKAMNKKWLVIQVIVVVFTSLFIFFVGKDILLGVLGVGSIVIYISYLSRMGGSLNDVSSNTELVQESKDKIHRMMTMFGAEKQDEGTKILKNWSRIQLQDLAFRYKDKNVLDGLSLTINKGDKIGIVGLSGSGKSTLFKLLLKLHKPQEGNVYFDDTDIQEIAQPSLLGAISVVPQETELFNASIKQNIVVVETDKIDYGRYAKALEISQAAAFVGKLKNKDLTKIGEKGFKVSGGERQRIGIARAIYKNSDIIIFDEATSNLDYETERKIQEGLHKYMKDKTLIVAAHRLSTLKNMDKVYVIEKGRVSEEGTFNDLHKKKGTFARLLRAQEHRK